jgi:membrane-associated protease RseP (regulator of RpoE activity)
MAILYALAILTVIVVVHEFGHAVAMYSKGVEIEIFSIGFRPYSLPAFSWKSKRFRGMIIQITPLLLGGYVKPTAAGNQTMERLSKRDRSLVFGAGVIANILFGVVVGIAILIYKKGLSFSDVLTDPLIITAAGLVVFLCWGRYVFTQYLMAPIGIMIAIFTLYLIIKSPGTSVVGPIGIVENISKQKEIADFLLKSVILSFSLALMNCMPIMPLDGGQRVRDVIKSATKNKYAIGIFDGIGTVLILALIIFAIGGDIWRLVF